jgi:putative hemolysin
VPRSPRTRAVSAAQARAYAAKAAEVHAQLSRLLPLKTTAEYDPDDIPGRTASKAVERARRCVATAQRLIAALRP